MNNGKITVTSTATEFDFNVTSAVTLRNMGDEDVSIGFGANASTFQFGEGFVLKPTEQLSITDDDGRFAGGVFVAVMKNSPTIKSVSLAYAVDSTRVDVTGVTLDEETLELEPEDTAQLTATVTPSGATNKNVSWMSTDEDVATVDEDGLVTAVADGSADIVVITEDGEFTAVCVVTVATE